MKTEQPHTMSDNPILPAPPTVLDGHDYALLGIVVHPVNGPRFAYSLNALANKRKILCGVSLERAREHTWEMVVDIVREHGDMAPVFIDDDQFNPETVGRRIATIS